MSISNLLEENDAVSPHYEAHNNSNTAPPPQQKSKLFSIPFSFWLCLLTSLLFVIISYTLTVWTCVLFVVLIPFVQNTFTCASQTLVILLPIHSFFLLFDNFVYLLGITIPCFKWCCCGHKNRNISIHASFPAKTHPFVGWLRLAINLVVFIFYAIIVAFLYSSYCNSTMLEVNYLGSIYSQMNAYVIISGFVSLVSFVVFLSLSFGCCRANVQQPSVANSNPEEEEDNSIQGQQIRRNTIPRTFDQSLIYNTPYNNNLIASSQEQPLLHGSTHEEEDNLDYLLMTMQTEQQSKTKE